MKTKPVRALRVYHAVLLGAYAVALLACLICDLSINRALTSVSYTHLDVYKRQGRRGVLRADVRAFQVPDVDRAAGKGGF